MATRGGGGRRGGYQQPPSRGGGNQQPSGRGGGRQPFAGRGEGEQQFAGRGGGRQPFAGRGEGEQQFAGRGTQAGRGGRYGGGGDAGGRGYNAPPPQQAFPSVPQTQPLSVPAAPLLSEATRALEKLNLQSSATSATASSSSAPPAGSSSAPPAGSSSASPTGSSAHITDTRLTELPPASSKAVKFVPRPNFGKSGRTCVIRANHFRVTFAVKDIHHYDVKITPEVLSKKVCRDIMKALTTTYQSHLGMRRIAYDGRKSLYAAGALPFESQDFDVILAGTDGSKRERKFEVKITFAAQTDLHQLQEFLNRKQRDAPQDTIQALDVVFRESPSDLYVPVGRSFFSPRLGDVGSLGEGLDYWYGFYQSLRPTQMGLSLNIDISARPFYEPILVTDFIVQCLNLRGGPTRPLSEQDRLKVKKALRGIKVEIAHPQSVRRYKITGVSTQPLNQLTFSVDGSGSNTSVANYFREKYNIALQYGHLPALQAGNDARPAYLPMEVCKIVAGQRYAKKLNERQVSVMLKATCQRPKDREQNIKKMVARNNYSNDFLVNKEFGMQVNGELTSINARVLDPPRLKYHPSGKEPGVQPRVGQWNMINKKMINGGRVDAWTCVNFSRAHVNAVYQFCEELIAMCSSKGMVFNPTPVLPIESDQPRSAEKLLDYVHSECNKMEKVLQLLIVILPETSGLYGTIKRVCETELGIVSQCCQPKHVSRINKQYLENVSLKINVKVGGTNVHLDQAAPRKDHLRDMPTIVFGADVTHPQPGDDSSSSIAAVVASMDWPNVTKYRCLVSAQSHRQEIIKDLYTCSDESKNVVLHGGMIREHLRAYYNSTGRKPNRIIFYRDGVSEGQFSQVLFHEVDAIRKACQSLQEGYLPPITFVVVQKRHHTRLFPSVHGDQNSTDRSGNILPGTVVDTEICHPTEFDFYLCSHAGIQGTSRPTHYHVLFDENKFNADDLQHLTNNLCYTYARCTRSVSIVPAAYYAHLAAFRARYYVEGRTSDGDSTFDGRRGQQAERPVVEVRRLPDIKDNVKQVMFYC